MAENGSSSESDSNSVSSVSPVHSICLDDGDVNYIQSGESDIENDSIILPYNFEPEYTPSDNHEIEGSLEHGAVGGVEISRQQTTEWCQCGKCVIMETVEECTCCKEKDVIEEILQAYTEYADVSLSCITEHPGFKSNCLDVWVLQAAYRNYSKGDKQQMGDHPQNEKYRYVAYRQLVKFCWGRLGKNNRIPLPSCALLKIREVFPSDTYTYFKYPKLM